VLQGDVGCAGKVDPVGNVGEIDRAGTRRPCSAVRVLWAGMFAFAVNK
jgi:hypothetical protein